MWELAHIMLKKSGVYGIIDQWRCIMRKHSKEKTGSGSVRMAVAGLSLMLLTDIVNYLVMYISDVSIVKWAVIIVTAVAWLMVIAGVKSVRYMRKEYARAFFVACIGLAADAGQGVLAALAMRRAAAVDPFGTMKVMFAGYASVLCMFLVMYLLVRGTGQLFARAQNMKKAKMSVKKSNIDPLVALAFMVVITFGTVFSMPVSIIIGAVGILVNALMRIDMINYILEGMKSGLYKKEL